MDKTYTEIKTEAQSISGATGNGSITKAMVGGAIEDVLDYAKEKVDKITDPVTGKKYALTSTGWVEVTDGASSASDLSFNTSGTSLTKTNVQEAIEELDTSVNDIETQGYTKIIDVEQQGFFVVDSEMNIGFSVGYSTSFKERLKTFIDNVEIHREWDSSSNANYYLIRIYKNKIDGTTQVPHVVQADSATTSLSLSSENDYMLVVNAGIFDMTTKVADGIVIQDGVVKKNGATTTHPKCKPLTIDANGDLSYASYDSDANQLVNSGIVDAVCGFMPIIIDYEAVPQSDWNDVSHYTQNAQRQIIGQFHNGDYGILTSEGRNSVNSDGWTIAEAQEICKKWGFKFAYNLDGGGSTETVIGKKMYNHVYENTTGRAVPTFIVFR